ncbi:ankyrin repeat domain-containing protein [Gloeobacter kilaueensis]|uniref:Uncharacterized protein n=1 Tax=Gloeobacter kilaueensis (strain ATCC BAA-2537 / CCAP 1431/1 / ULC 316 / JS1) TaxID=1183438 RepID=U5QM35_GLOK1|nr:ankyrin repeat domain-containing protein [Gloeobacter kilaueensis]AGY58674.1 hypothetical protein GKIL_2428 [Gloeobacter kilaueensis JS1]
MSTSPFYRAIQAGNLPLVQRLLAAGASLEGERDRLTPWLLPQSTPLIEAIRSHHLPIAALLLELGADPNAFTRTGTTPLAAAVQLDDDEAVRLLLEWGADVNFKTNAQMASPLQRAAYDGQENLVRLLLAHGARPDTVLQNDVSSLIRIRGPILQMLIDAGGRAPDDILKLLRDGAALP